MVGELSIEILKEIRDEIRNVRTELRGIRGDALERFGLIEAALLDLVDEQGHGLRHGKVGVRLRELESRVGKLESK